MCGAKKCWNEQHSSAAHVCNDVHDMVDRRNHPFSCGNGIKQHRSIMAQCDDNDILRNIDLYTDFNNKIQI
jgi:hypothetical protein